MTEKLNRVDLMEKLAEIQWVVDHTYYIPVGSVIGLWEVDGKAHVLRYEGANVVGGEP